jgi:hypothetical protein
MLFTFSVEESLAFATISLSSFALEKPSTGSKFFAFLKTHVVAAATAVPELTPAVVEVRAPSIAGHPAPSDILVPTVRNETLRVSTLYKHQKKKPSMLTHLGLFLLVLAEGLEPPRLAPLVPKTSVSTIPPCEQHDWVYHKPSTHKRNIDCSLFEVMKNIKDKIKKQADDTENLVLDTQGGEMPDPNAGSKQTASEAAQVFQNRSGNNVKDENVQDAQNADDVQDEDIDDAEIQNLDRDIDRDDDQDIDDNGDEHPAIQKKAS